MKSAITMVLGASTRGDRYSHMAVIRLVESAVPVLAVGLSSGEILGVPIVRDVPHGVVIHTVSLYLNPLNQLPWIDRIMALAPKRIIFNPGTENSMLEKVARDRGIEVVHGCTLVMLAAGTY